MYINVSMIERVSPTASTSTLELNESKITYCIVNRTGVIWAISNFQGNIFIFLAVFIQEWQNECAKNRNPKTG
jgi:hypothetical protein